MSDDIRESHRTRLGCSEIAAALGLSRWKTPYQLWQEKTGVVEPASLDGQLRIDLGNLLEDIVAQLYEKETGFQVVRSRPEKTSDAIPYLVGHIDRRIVGHRRGLEIKTHLSRFTSDEWGPVGTDQIPVDYYLQSMGYLILTQYHAWDVAVLLAGPEMRKYTIYPNSELMAWIKRGLDGFWRHVTEKTPPDPVNLEDANRRWPNAIQQPTFARPADMNSFRELAELKKSIAKMEEQAALLELSLKESMKECDALVDPATSDVLCTWKSQESKRVSVKLLRELHPAIASEVIEVTQNRVFRLRKGK